MSHGLDGLHDCADGYKKSTVGVIPVDWEVSTIGQEFEIKLGKMLDAAKNTGIPKFYLNNKAVQWGRIDTNDLPTVLMSQEDLDRYRLRQGDLLVCEGGEVGRAAIWEAQIPECYYQKALHRLRPLGSCYINFMLALFKYFADHRLFANYTTQTSIAHLTREKLAGVPIPLPPLPEQKAIALSLSDTDALIAACESAITKKRNIKQGAMQQLLTGKMRLPGFSGEWEVKKLGDCLIRNPEYGINAPAVPYSGNLPVYIRITDISEDGRFLPENKVSVNHNQSANYLLETDDLVLARTGASTGKSYLYNPKDGELVFAGFLIKVKVNPQKLDARYLKGFLNTKTYWNWVIVMSMRSGQPGINGNEYAQLPIPLPPLPEQKVIAQILSDMDAEIAALEKKRDKYKAIKQGMMQELLTGRTRLNAD